SSPDADEAIMVIPQDASLMVAGETAGTRAFVYLPTEPTSRRTGYGWIEQDAMESTSPPRGIALPSPSFRAVPLSSAGAYRVRPDDSVQSLAARSGVSSDELIRLNGLDRTGQIVVGQVLHMPDRSSAAPANRDSPRLVRDLSPGWVSAEHAVV